MTKAYQKYQAYQAYNTHLLTTVLTHIHKKGKQNRFCNNTGAMKPGQKHFKRMGKLIGNDYEFMREKMRDPSLVAQKSTEML